MSFFNELKRRNVFKVGIAYIIIAWVLMQIGDTLGPALLLPDWINSALAFFLLLGFPLALFFAWAFEMTPEGVKKQKDIDRSESITSQTGRKLDYTIIGLLAVALIYFVWESRFENEPPSEAVAQTKSVTEAETVVAAITNEPEQAATKQSIAVLPFDNRSALEEDEFFVDGLNQTSMLLNGDGYGRRDYHFAYAGPHLQATIKEQFKAHWPPPGSPGFALPVFDLYRDLKETKPMLAKGMWSVQYFADMRARHMALKKKFPDRAETHGKPYGGIANLRPETEALLEYYYAAQRASE